jgi:uncharacterized protein YraI
MKLRQSLMFLLVTCAFLLQACGGQDTESAIATGIAQTLQISELQTAAAGGGVQATVDPGQPSATPLPQGTATITLTATSSIPYVTVSENTNCRTGPSTSYGLVTTITVGQQAEVVNVFSGANYVVVRNPNGSGFCWLWLQYATPTNFSAYNLPQATQPPTPTITPTPTPEYIWDGNWAAWIDVNADGTLVSCPMVMNRSGNNLTGTYDCGTFDGTITGTLSNGLRNASGTWANSLGGSGTFTFQRKLNNVNQFIGNYDGGYAWCGGRASASQPSPCFGP